MADVQLALLRQQRQGQGILVVVSDQPDLDGVGDSLVPVVVLIENMPTVNASVFVNNQHCPADLLNQGSSLPPLSYSSNSRRVMISFMKNS